MKRVLLLMALASAGCVGDYAFTCGTTKTCGANGVCVQGGCAFTASDCASGLRYDKSAQGAISGQCTSPDIRLDLSMPMDLSVPMFDLVGADFAGDDLTVPPAPIDLATADFAKSPDLLPRGADMACIPQGAENCFDGIDNDCNGMIDCADPACSGGGSPIAECVQDAPGFQLGTDTAAGSLCPTHYTVTATTVMQGLNAPLVCGGCSCTPSLVCSTTVHTMVAATCPGGALVAPTIATDSGTCNSNGGNGYNLTTQNVRVDALTKSATCSAGGTPTPQAAAWGSTNQFCQTTQKGAGCPIGFVCVAKVPVGNKHCALQAGTATCPGNYAVEGSGGAWFTNFTDSRSCGASCAAVCTPSGGSCGTSFVKAFLAKSCTGASDFLTPGMDNCGESVGENAFQVTLQNSVNPTCTANYSASGSATPIGNQTLCCL